MTKLVSVGKASELLGISHNTLRSYGELGIIKEVRLNKGHRRYRLSDIEKLQGISTKDTNNIRACCYCRVSSNDQKKHGDLERQKLRVLEFCSEKEFTVSHVFVEVCSGMKAKRPTLDKLYELVRTKQIDVVVVEHKDRLTRFMFDVFREFFLSHNVQILIVEEELPKTFENELVSDIISIMTSFTATLYGRRKKQSKDFIKRMDSIK